MIGREATGDIGRRKPASRSRPESDRRGLRERVIDLVEPVVTFVTRVVRVVRWVLEQTAVIFPVRWYQWQTANDERTCPECGSMNGRTWHEQQAIPAPPLHGNCRCRVVHAWTEWRVRFVPAWRLRWFTRQTWEWTRTGWA